MNTNSENVWSEEPGFRRSILGPKLFYRSWKKTPWASPRALLIVHGFGEHSGRYTQFYKNLGEEFDWIVAQDHLGHGLSDGWRGDVLHFDFWVKDFRALLNEMHEQLVKRFGRSEIHLLGHSMGGAIVLKHLLSEETTLAHSASLSSPLMEVALPVPRWKNSLGKILSKTLPWFPLDAGVHREYLTHDLDIVRAHEADPLVHHRITPRTYFSMLEALESNRNKIAKWARRSDQSPLPLFVQYAGDDHIVSADACADFVARCQGQGVFKAQCYPSLFHEIFNEKDRAAVFEDLKQWIKTIRN